MSAISEIYDAIGDIDIAGVSVRGIDEVKLAVRQDDLPVRMILPSTEGNLEFIAIGTLNKLTWVIRDLCLWAPLSAGSGVAQYSEDMVAYIASYIAEIKLIRNPTSFSNITGVAFQMGPVPWANGDYWSVDITLTIDEII